MSCFCNPWMSGVQKKVTTLLAVGHAAYEGDGKSEQPVDKPLAQLLQVLTDRHAEFVGVEIQPLVCWRCIGSRHAPRIVGNSTGNAERESKDRKWGLRCQSEWIKLDRNPVSHGAWHASNDAAGCVPAAV